MRRLFTLGCSFTRYHWPTWADIVGKEFDQFQNWANSGLGNRAILERLSELVVRNLFTEYDVIVVQWSDFHRFDTHIPHRFPEDGWSTFGSIHANPMYTERWILDNWCENSYVMHTCNFVHLASALLDHLPCKWYMTSMNSMDDYIEQFIVYDNYLPLFRHDKWLPPIKPYFDSGFYKQKHFKKLTSKDKFDVWDPHPTPLAHYDYANEHLAQKLGVSLDRSWAESADTILDSLNTHDQIRSTLVEKLGWDNHQSWIRGL